MPLLPWVGISTAFLFFTWRNDIKSKYIFLFPQRDSVHNGLTVWECWLFMMLGAFSWSWLSQKLMLTMPTKCSLKWRIITLSALSSLEAYFMKTSWHGHPFYIAGPLCGESTLIQVMAWCRQATSHYLSLCLPRAMLLHLITRPQWVDIVSGWSRLLGWR